MKLGKVTQTVRKRSVLKQLKSKRREIFPEMTVEETCWGLKPGEGESILLAEAARYGDQKDLGVYAIAAAANDLAAHGASVVGVSARIMLTAYAYESRLKAMVAEMEQAAEEQGFQLADVKVEICPVISTTIVSVTAAGLVKEEEMCRVFDTKAGQELVLTKWIGMEGTLRALEERKEELEERFVPAFLKQTELWKKHLFVQKEAEIARKYKASAMHTITEEGVLGALWEMADSAGLGMCVEMRELPIRQETVEICEFCHLNPYELTSAGCLLIAAEDGAGLVEELRRAHIPAAVIGRFTDGNDRILMRGEEVSYLDRPAADELMKLFADEKEA